MENSVSENVSSKKQRNVKNRRDKCKNKGPTTSSDKTSGQADQNPSQPQNTNSAKSNSSSENNEALISSKENPQDGKQSGVIDLSKLKRETAEIQKLTKKFTKREITSNWHRFTAPERAEDQEDTEPADFSDLLQVPASRGGHLLLKDEKEWSSVNHTGYWALDLRRLSFGLACIPTHKRLTLPEDKLSEEEITRYNNLADEAQKYYKADEGSDYKEEKETSFNILDIEKSTKLLLDMNLELDDNSDDVSPTNQLNIKGPNGVKMESNLNVCKPVTSQNEKSRNNNVLSVEVNCSQKEEKSTNNTQKITNETQNSISETRKERCDLEKAARSSEIKNEPLPKADKVVKEFDLIPEYKTEPTLTYEIKERRPNKVVKDFSSTLECKTEPLNIKDRQPDKVVNDFSSTFVECKTENYEINERRPDKVVTDFSSTLECKTGLPEIKDRQPDKVVNDFSSTFVECKSENYEIKERRPQRTNRKKSPVNDKTINKTADVLESVKLEDDDDLDFLLSLKKPIESPKVNATKPAPLKESSFLPGKDKAAPKVQKQPSDLDDWLDSVLQD